jgi:hypothetical protein
VTARSAPGTRAPVQPVGGRRASLTGVGGVLLITGVALVGGCVDVLTGTGLRFAFAVCLVLGSLLATALVRRGDLLTVVLAPPLVYLAASLLSVFAAPGDAGGTGALIDAAAGWLVYGFPAIATATGGAALVAGVRMARGSRP